MKNRIKQPTCKYTYQIKVAKVSKMAGVLVSNPPSLRIKFGQLCKYKAGYILYFSNSPQMQ